MKKIENSPTVIFFAAWGSTSNGLVHQGKLINASYLQTGQPNLISATSEVEFLKLCNENNIPVPNLPELQEVIQEGLYKTDQTIVLSRKEHILEDNTYLVSNTIPVWVEDERIEIGLVREENNKLWKCVQAHFSSALTKPSLARALWKPEPKEGEEWPAWEQPLGSEDTYPFEAKVNHKDKKWISERPHNVHEPSTVDSGWLEYKLTEESWPLWHQPIPGLTGREPYIIGAQVTFKDSKWVNTVENNVWVPSQYGWVEQTEGEIKPWKQPQGAHDAYNVGDKVTYNNATWINESPANVFAPGVFGWKKI